MIIQGHSANLTIANNPPGFIGFSMLPFLRKTLFIALPLITVFGIATLGYYSQQVAEVEQNAIKMNQYVNQVLSLKLQQNLRNLIGDARMLASNPLLPRALSNPSGTDARLLAEQWIGFSAQKRIYDQIRLLDLHGQETLRVNLTLDGANAVPREALQNKANRYYFKDAMALPIGQIYLSPLDLNIENNKIELPIKPMQRIAVSVVDANNSKVGLLVLNYLAENLMREIDTYSVMAESKNLLLNQKGYFLHGMTRDREWLFMYPKQDQNKGIFTNTYANAWQAMQRNRNGQLKTDQGIFNFHWLATDELTQGSQMFNRRLVIVSLVSKQQLLALKAPYTKAAWGVTLLGFPAIFVFAALISYFRLRELSAFERLQQTEANQRLILESVGEGILGIDAHGRLTFANSRAETLTGYPQNEMLGRPLHSLIHRCEKNHSQHRAKACPLQECLTQGKSHLHENDTFIRKNCDPIPVEYICNPIIKNGMNQGGVLSFFDITARKQAEQRIEYLAFYDPLTNLPNKRLFLDRLKQQLAAARNNNQVSALLYIDIDRFKQINDALGHTSGDRILTETAQRLKYITQEGDTVAHIGSDEFTMLLANQAADSEQIAHNAQITADEIMLILQQPYYLDRDTVRMTVSIGITLFPFDHEDASTILAQADTAVANAKNDGRFTTRFFRTEMEQATKDWLLIHNRMLEALAHDAFTLVYQPKVEQHRRIIGIEALLRWNDEALGIVKPIDFIPIAEQSGLILQINNYVLNQVCRQIKLWSDDNLLQTLGHIAINVSPTQFINGDFVEYILEHIQRSGIAANKLELEITEQTLVTDTTDVRDKLLALRKHGIRFSIDDFGTGYSSLAYLQQLPLDRLKIDRAFITNVDKILERQKLVEAIVTIAKGLAIDVIAEGVETEEELNYLLNVGCHEFQGYHFYPPMGADMITRLLRENRDNEYKPLISTSHIAH
ncbi:MAG: EAL domain-containing protein [Candidatus Thiodiazotropha sp.]